MINKSDRVYAKVKFSYEEATRAQIEIIMRSSQCMATIVYFISIIIYMLYDHVSNGRAHPAY